MLHKAQDRLDGAWIDTHKARYVGTIELDGADWERAAFGTRLVCVTVVHVGAANTRETLSGENHRTNGFKVIGHHICDAELAEALIERCNLPGFDTLFSYIPPGNDTPAPNPAAMPAQPQAAPDQAPDGDESVGATDTAPQEPPVSDEPDDELDVDDEPEIEQPGRREHDGPKTARWSAEPSDEETVWSPRDGRGDIEVIGHVGESKDPHLARFMQETNRA